MIERALRSSERASVVGEPLKPVAFVRPGPSCESGGGKTWRCIDMDSKLRSSVMRRIQRLPASEYALDLTIAKALALKLLI